MSRRTLVALLVASLIGNALLAADALRRRAAPPQVDSITGLPDPKAGILMRLRSELRFVPATEPIPFSALAQKHFPRQPRVTALIFSPDDTGDEGDKHIVRYSNEAGPPEIMVEPGDELWVADGKGGVPPLWTPNEGEMRRTLRGIQESVSVSLAGKIRVGGTTTDWSSSSWSGEGSRVGTIDLHPGAMEIFEREIAEARSRTEPNPSGLRWLGSKVASGFRIEVDDDEVVDSWSWGDYEYVTVLDRGKRQLRWFEDWE